ncbi:hypothetical protein PENTCL1PPCAC_17723, partial [Pristionchus entomophagus]
WKYDSYQDHSDLSGILDTKRDSSSENEENDDDDKSTTGSGSTATLVDNKENQTPIVGSTPASRLSSNTQMHRKKERVINVSAVLEKNKELEGTVFDLKMKLGQINKELPWIMINGVDHLAQYIQFKKDNESLRERMAQYEKNLQLLKEDNEEMMRKDRDRMEQEHLDDVARLQAEYERVCQECEDLREEIGRGPLPSTRELDRSMISDGSSLWSERSRQVGLFELKIEGLEKDVKIAKNAVEKERSERVKALKEVDELRRNMEEKEREWERRASITSLQETFYIGIDGASRGDMREMIQNQLLRIDTLEKELDVKSETETKMGQVVKELMKQRSDLENELRAVREGSMSIMENREVDEIMRELLELSEMNSQLQEECRRRGAIRIGKKEREEGGKGLSMENIKKELETTYDICDQYQKMGDRLAPLQQRIVAMNKSVMDRRSFLEGLKGFEMSGLTPIRLGDGSYGRSGSSGTGGTGGTPVGREPQSRLLHTVLQRSVLNVSHSEILNCSINTSQGIKNAKDKLISMRESCRRLFEKLQSSYALFDEIRLALGGEENAELARQMAELRIDLEQSVMDSGEAAKAIEVVENSLFELQSMLETSIGGEGEGMGRESAFNLSVALGRREREGEENMEEEGRRKDLTYSVQVTAQNLKVSELMEKLSVIEEEYRGLKDRFEELEKENEETKMLNGSQDEKYRSLQKEREVLHREVESRRAKEEEIIEKNERLLNELEKAGEDVKDVQRRCKEEIEETVGKMQDVIDRLDAEAFEVKREMEDRLEEKEEEMKTIQRRMEEKEIEMESLNRRMEDMTRELNGLRNMERTNGTKMSRLEREAENYRESLARTTEEYAKLNEELDIGKKREEDLERKLHKYKYKAIEEAELIRKTNERDESSTQTSLTMEKLSRLEWSKNELSGELNRLGRTIEEAFLKKGDYDTNPQRWMDEMDVNRLVEIVVKEKQKKNENIAIMMKNNEELKRYEEERNGTRRPSPDESGDGRGVERDLFTTVEGVSLRYSDPLRQLFYSLTCVAQDLVQRYKKAQIKMCSGGLSEGEFTIMLDMMRDLRGKLNEKFTLTSQRHQSDADGGDARMALRMAVVMEANEKLKARISQLMTAMKCNWNAEEKAKLLEKVVNEMSEISKTLTSTVGVKGRTVSSSSAATASTRKI